MSFTFAPIIWAVILSDMVSSTVHVVSVQTAIEICVSFVVERNFPWNVLNETLVKSYQEPISIVCCRPHG